MTEHGSIIKVAASPHFNTESVLRIRNGYAETYETLRDRENSLVRRIRGTWTRTWITAGAFAVQFPIMGIMWLAGNEPGPISAVALGLGGTAAGLSTYWGRKGRRALRDAIDANRKAMFEPATLLRVWEKALEMKDWDEQLAVLEVENWRVLNPYAHRRSLSNDKPNWIQVNHQRESHATIKNARGETVLQAGANMGPKTRQALAKGGFISDAGSSYDVLGDEDENAEARRVARELIASLDELLTPEDVQEAMDTIEKLGDLGTVEEYEVTSALRRGGRRKRKLEKSRASEVLDLTDWQGDDDPRRLWAEDNERERQERIAESRRASGWTQIQIDREAQLERDRKSTERAKEVAETHRREMEPWRPRRDDRRPPFDPGAIVCTWCAHDPHRVNHTHWVDDRSEPFS